MLNWGILGTARINRSLIPPLRLSFRNQLLAVASRDAGKAAAYAAERDIPRSYGSYEALLADEDIQVIYIPLPNKLHAEWAIKAAQAGKHVLCEKPLALTVEEVDRMEKAAADAGTILMEAFMYRFHARTQQVKAMVDEGLIGDLHHIKGGFTFALNREGDVRWDNKLGGGSLWDVGCYPLNFARFITGQEPEKVFGHQVSGASGVDISFAAHLQFPGDITAQFDSGFRTQFRMYTEVAGSKGSIHLPMAFKPGLRSYIHLTRGNTKERIAVDGNMLYLDEVEEITNCVLEDRQPALSLAESRGNIAAIQALYDSASSGQVVTL
ncbi:MAG: Gfo/Idh/MocA family oxidoreductase [Bacteroidota bacterium]